jgi:putative membrane protein
VSAPGPVLPEELWGAWSPDPLVVVGLGAAAWAYGRGLARMWGRAGRGRGVTPTRAVAFYTALLAVAVALISPLHALGETLFSAHMVQHLVIIVVAPPLLV